MNGTKAHWMIAGLAAIAGALAALLVVEYLHAGASRVAYGQMGENTGGANYTLALMGVTASDATPIVLIDTHKQTIMVYEYMVSTRSMYLRVVRSYENDRELRDNIFYQGGNVYAGPSVTQVQGLTGGRR